MSTWRNLNVDLKGFKCDLKEFKCDCISDQEIWLAYVASLHKIVKYLLVIAQIDGKLPFTPRSKNPPIWTLWTWRQNDRSGRQLQPLIPRGGSSIRGPPGTSVVASHLRPPPAPPLPEVRVCATNIFTQSDTVAGAIRRFVNSRLHHLRFDAANTLALLAWHPVFQIFDIITPRYVPAFSCCPEASPYKN